MIAWIEKERKARRWSKRELARRSGLSHAHVANILREDRDITWDFCLAIAHGLGEPVLKVFVMAGLLGEDDVPPDVNSDEEARLIIKAVNDLPISARKEAMSYLKWLKVQHQDA